MKQAILALALIMAASSASATGTLHPIPVTVVNFPEVTPPAPASQPQPRESWLASGWESVTQEGSQAVNYLRISEPGFSTEVLCRQFLLNRDALVVGTAANGKTQKHAVDADCYIQTPAPVTQ
jgi:hypothetical protein